MMLSPKAHRLVAEAISTLPDSSARTTWVDWAERPSEVTDEVASVAIEALENVAKQIVSQLTSGRLDEDEQADLTNDLYFIQCIEDDLKRVA
jgi:hypothetical protein